MRRYNKSRFNKKRVNRGSRIRSGPTGKPIVSVPFSVPSFYLAQASSGNGGFTTAVSGASLTANNGFSVDPFNIGGNVYQLASLYAMYRIRRLTLTYVPFDTASGVGSIVTGGASSPTYLNRAFAMHFVLDPAFTNSSYTSILASSGLPGNTTRRYVYNVRGGNLKMWRYTSTTSASPTGIDLRYSAVGRIEMAFQDTSTTATANYGMVMLSGIADYEGVIDRSVPIGLSISQEERKSDQDSPILQVVEDETINVSQKPPSSTPKLQLQLTNQKAISSGNKQYKY